MNNNQKSQEKIPGVQPGLAPAGLLGCVEPDLAPVFQKLRELRDKYEAANEGRIAWEITQGIRALDEAVYLAKVYISGKPLPTIAEMRGILKQPNVES
jgi:hypothetical protein